MAEVLVKWNGHACFTVEAEGYILVFDPYADGSVPGLGPLRLRANEVLCSHEHHDHNFREAVDIIPWNGERPFLLETMDVFHDDRHGAQRGKNRIHVIDCGGVRVAHLGDLGHELSPEQLRALAPLDAVMIPVGGYYTVDAHQASHIADALGARVVIPMHFRQGNMGFPVIGTLNSFLALRTDIVYARDPWITVTHGGHACTLVMQL